MSTAAVTLFQAIDPIIHNVRSKAIHVNAASQQLELFAQAQQEQAPLHVHTYRLPVNPPEVQRVDRELLWKAVRCKAAEPEAFVERILKSQIVGAKRPDGFVRTITFKNEPSKEISEDVFIGDDTIIFAMHSPEQFVAVNHIVEEAGQLYLQGTYMEAKERTQEVFLDSASGVINQIRENALSGKVEALFRKHFVTLIC